MANETARPIEAERNTPKDPRDHPAAPSGLPPLPYFPMLCRALGGATISLVVCYLEIHHSAPQPIPEARAGLRSTPVYVDCDQMCASIGVNRRTLHIALYCLAVWWRSEEMRSSAARAGREFLNQTHTLHGKVKPYSIVGTRDQKINQTFIIRRNFGRINQILTEASIDQWHEPAQQALHKYSVEDQPCAFTHTARELAEILEKASYLGVRNGWTEERKRAQSVIMKAIWERRKKSGRENNVFGDIEIR